MTQEQLNTLLAEELNKWQTIYEYATLFVDRANERNKRFNLVIWLFKEKYVELILAVLGCITAYRFQTDAFVLIVVFSLLLFLLFIFGMVWSNFSDDKKILELNCLQRQTSSYLANLKRWLARMDLHEKQTNNEVKFIEQEFNVAQMAQTPLFDIYSSHHGKLNKIMNERAKERAKENLKPFQTYIQNE